MYFLVETKRKISNSLYYTSDDFSDILCNINCNNNVAVDVYLIDNTGWIEIGLFPPGIKLGL